MTDILNPDTLVLGAVAYDAKVVTIWDGFQKWFAEQGFAFDYVLYSSYERQVAAHFDGAFDVAWNSPLAWIQAQRLAKARGRSAEAIAMRDTDQDLTSVIVTRDPCEVKTVEDLRGKVVGVGAGDSPQATMIPLQHLAELGLIADKDFEVRRFDVLVGKHGDHVGGERDAAKALMAGEVDAACMIDGNHLLFTNEGTLPQGKSRVLTQTGTYDHCNFTVLDGAPAGRVAKFKELLMSMSYEDPAVRPLLDLEGLKQWRDGRVSGYQLLEQSCDRFGYLDPFMKHMGAA